MRIVPAAFEGVFLLDIEPREDDRGFLARTFSADELAAFGMKTQVAQTQVSWNNRPGTLRGLYFERAPARAAARTSPSEARIVRCTHGRLFHVLVDLRPASPTFKRWDGIELSQSNRRSIYIPSGFAHGFQTLSAEAELLTQLTGPQILEPASGFRYDDPTFDIAWPDPVQVISPRDRGFPLFE